MGLWVMRCGATSLTREIRIVNRHISNASIVQDLQLGSVGHCNVGKVFGVICVHVLRVRMASLVSQVVPLGSGKRQFGACNLVWRQDALEIIPFAQISAAFVLDFASADD